MTKCSHESSAHVNRPFIVLESALAAIAHVQWPQVGFSIHVRAGEKHRHNSHRWSIILGGPFPRIERSLGGQCRLLISRRTMRPCASPFMPQGVCEQADVDAKIHRLRLFCHQAGRLSNAAESGRRAGGQAYRREPLAFWPPPTILLNPP
jgi:hypothetical protein